MKAETMYPFWKITPGGNPTVLMRACDVPRALRSCAAARIMSDQHLGCEQVGFVHFGQENDITDQAVLTSHDPAPSLPRLDMMGGEFCLNATRAFALLLTRQGRLPRLAEGVFGGEISVSGMAEPVDVRVETACSLPASTGKPAACRASATLRLPASSLVEQRSEGVTIVRIPGIVHLILDTNKAGPAPAPADRERVCADLRRRYGLENEEAVGCLWLDEQNAPPVMSPAVWVRDTQSLCLESACGSGTLACALYLDRDGGPESFAIRQPSGATLTVSLEKRPDSWLARVDGPVEYVAEGLLCLEPDSSAS